mmetsp:Transcript_7937/g.24113  ORF Transcript_7937/g.24113 Transcript_7937/m.24113 type:complete len:90 (-) Transcript_7937:81-350(-)
MGDEGASIDVDLQAAFHMGMLDLHDPLHLPKLTTLSSWHAQCGSVYLCNGCTSQRWSGMEPQAASPIFAELLGQERLNLPERVRRHGVL